MISLFAMSEFVKSSYEALETMQLLLKYQINNKDVSTMAMFTKITEKFFVKFIDFLQDFKIFKHRLVHYLVSLFFESPNSMK